MLCFRSLLKPRLFCTRFTCFATCRGVDAFAAFCSRLIVASAFRLLKPELAGRTLSAVCTISVSSMYSWNPDASSRRFCTARFPAAESSTKSSSGSTRDSNIVVHVSIAWFVNAWRVLVNIHVLVVGLSSCCDAPSVPYLSRSCVLACCENYQSHILLIKVDQIACAFMVVVLVWRSSRWVSMNCLCEYWYVQTSEKSTHLLIELGILDSALRVHITTVGWDHETLSLDSRALLRVIYPRAACTPLK